MPRITTDPGYTDIYSDLYGGTTGDVLLFVDVAFTTAPLATPAWTDITPEVRAVSTNRGRSSEFDTFSAGTASLELDNRDRRFEPNYASSPYYPNVKPNRRVRVRMNYLGVEYHLYSGHADGWPQDYINPREATVSLSASDAFKVFAKSTVTNPILQLDDEEAAFLDQAILAGPLDTVDEMTGARIQRVLTGFGWPALSTDLDTGRTPVPGTHHAKGQILDYLQRVASSEDGRLFLSADGKVTFLDRHAPFLDTESATSQATFGDVPPELGYSDIRLPYDADQIRNHVSVRLPGGESDADSEVSVEDATSIAEYLRNSYDREVLFTDTDEAEGLAQYILNRYKDPLLRVEAIVIKPLRDPTNLVPAVLSREIGDRVTVKRRPAGGTAITQAALIEGISHGFTPHGEWTVTWSLSPADTDNYLILNSATGGLLDTALLGY